MRILGIDPGYGIVGFGIVDYGADRKYNYVTHGVIKTSTTDTFGLRLTEIFEDMHSILNKYKPDKVCVEQLFFAKNITTAMKVAEAKGVILYSVAKYGLEAVDVTPLQVKSGLTGDGKATKTQVKQMVRTFLNQPDLKGIDDAVDALAVAIAGVGI
jgi:crossover junction endodeoxyribonuclease RuvC